MSPAEQFTEWFWSARPGDSFEYFRGSLAYAREESRLAMVYSRHLPESAAAPLAVAGAAFSMAERGYLHLVQRLVSRRPDDVGEYAYLAVKRPNPEVRR